MIIGETVIERGQWDEADDTITLDESARHRRRMAMVSDAGIAFLLDLEVATLMRNGDAIRLSDGRIVEVRSSPEALVKIEADTPRKLLALAWQIGNRHLPAEIHETHILIRQDPVIEAMLKGLGARLTPIEAGFDPEGGAYGDPHHESHHGDHGPHDPVDPHP